MKTHFYFFTYVYFCLGRETDLIEDARVRKQSELRPSCWFPKSHDCTHPISPNSDLVHTSK